MYGQFTDILSPTPNDFTHFVSCCNAPISGKCDPPPPPPPPNPEHMGDLTFIESNAPAQLARLGVNNWSNDLLDPSFKNNIKRPTGYVLFYYSKQMKERAFAFIGIHCDTKCYMFFFCTVVVLYSI